MDRITTDGSVSNTSGESNFTTSNNSTTSNDDGLYIALMTIGCIFGIILFLFLLRKWLQGGQYRKTNRVDGKIIIITGCNTGIGKETALELAKRGAKIYMACRDSTKCETARLDIIKESKNENIFNRKLDLASLESIKKFVDGFLKEETRLDVLINNAGVMCTPKMLTKDGFEMQIGVNHIGHFYLTNLLLDILKKSSPSRIVVVSSLANYIGKINKNDINSEKSYKKFDAYKQSKLANVLFTKYLAKKLDGTGVTVNCCHPGLVKTELSRYFISGYFKKIADPLTSIFFKTPKSGAQTSIKLAIDPSISQVTGKYYSDCIRQPLLPNGNNEKMAEWLWETSCELTGLPNKFKTDIQNV